MTASITTGGRPERYWPPAVSRTLNAPQQSLWRNLAVAADRHPDKPAIVFGDITLRYGELCRRSEQVAGWLQQAAGVRRGDRVLLFAQNSPGFSTAYYAVLRADAMVVPVNAMSTADELAWLAGDSGATVAIVGPEMAERAAACTTLRSVLVIENDGEGAAALPADARFTGWRAALGAGLVPAAHAAGPDDLCVLPYTSGTTGKPKGCRHSHRTMQTALAAGAAWRQLGASEVMLAVAPMFHLLGMQSGMNMPIQLGATVVMLPRWDRAAAARLIPQHRVSVWAAPPTMVVDFFSQPGIDDVDLSSLRLLVGGGAPMPEAVAATLKARCGIVYNEAYGMTETASFLHGNPVGREKPQCLGVPSHGVDSRVVDPETLEELPPGEVGELVTHGAQIMLGYWGGAPDRVSPADATAFTTLPGDTSGKRFFRTGDLCSVDEEGYFFMRDRLKRMINASGFKVWPAEVENLLYAHPAIHEACVIATPDARAGEAVKAVVVLKPEARGTLQPADIVAWARTQMAVYKAPRHVQFVDSLPKSGTGKIMWRELQAAETSPGDHT
jgi:fatty-acyl-CoA synthase